MEANRIVRSPGSKIFQTIDSKMEVRLSALRAVRPLPLGIFLVLIPCGAHSSVVDKALCVGGSWVRDPDEVNEVSSIT
jgi:hypothetical protein